ncbi:hypothetical protein [Haliangium sp.]|uniref:hypothetical protein n=1 Tax=Haliangium sp. TaxID=2663208 RepID=UPI003D0DA610
MSTKEELVYEYWDCAYCGAVGVRGDQTICAVCGRRRDENIRFYRKEDAEELVTDEAQRERFLAGPDWLCAYCETLNGALDQACKNCGASKAESQKNYFQMHAERAPKAQAPAPTPRSRSKLPRILLILAILIALGLGFYWWATATHEASYVVSDLRWERAMEVERYQQVERSDWEGELRGDDIQRIRSRREVRRWDRRQVGTRTETYQDTERVQTGTRQDCKTSYKSTGSGASVKTTKCKDVPVYENRRVTRTRQVPVYEKFPVYGQKIDYRAKMYVPLDTVRAQGCDNQPTWPEPPVGTGVDGKPDRTRRGAATYLVELVMDGDGDGPETIVVRTDEAGLRDRYHLDAKITAAVSNLGGIELGQDEVDDTGTGAVLMNTWKGSPVDPACRARRQARGE